MDPFTLGIVVFVVGHAIIGVVTVSALLGSRREGLTGRARLARLLPSLAVETAWTVLFVVWFLTR